MIIFKILRIIREKEPNLIVDGPLQFDTALQEATAARKDKDGVLKGKANVLVFPDLNTGNTAYKTAQLFGKMSAIGPILQGLAKPVSDVSRSASVSDIVDIVATMAAHAKGNK